MDENLHALGRLYGLRNEDLNRRMAEQKERFRLEEDRRSIATLGRGGQRQTALACPPTHGPELLILEESTSGVDSLARRDL